MRNLQNARSYKFLGPVATVIEDVARNAAIDILDVYEHMAHGRQHQFIIKDEASHCAMRAGSQVVEFYASFDFCEVRVHAGETYVDRWMTHEVMIEGRASIINAISKWVSIGNIRCLADIGSLPPVFALLGDIRLDACSQISDAKRHVLKLPSRRWLIQPVAALA